LRRPQVWQISFAGLAARIERREERISAPIQNASMNIRKTEYIEFRIFR